MPIHAHFWRATLTRKVGQADLVSDMQSRFISRSVHGRWLQVCVCSGYDLFHPGLTFRLRHTSTHRQHLTSYI